MTRSAAAVVAIAVSVALAACGGDKGGGTPSTASAPAVASGASGADAAGSERDEPAGATATARRPAAKGEDATVLVGASGSGGVADPCRLVSREQGQAILGEPLLVPRVAPQGPTCIYEPERGATRSITVAVQSLDVGALQRQLGPRAGVDVATRPAFCGRRSLPTLYVPLSDERALVVAGNCDVAKRFAARALQRLGA